MIDVRGDIDGALAVIGVKPVGIGQTRLRDLCGIDGGVVARWSEHAATLMPHAGPAVVAALLKRLVEAGLIAEHDAACADPRNTYPEARSLVEARMLMALAAAPSRLAIDLLLDQPRRWTGLNDAEVDAAAGSLLTSADQQLRHAALARLLHAPLVVALGPPNIGKSSFLNALAGRGVSIVADEPGTTRDHVGAMLDLGGLVVRYLDAPGIELGACEYRRGTGATIDAEAQRVALRAAREADLIVSCCDPRSTRLALPEELAQKPRLEVFLRSDLAGTAEAERAAGDAIEISVTEARGLERAVSAMREALVPRAMIDADERWAFWRRG